jgi:uncharacterized membrane protein YhhN
MNIGFVAALACAVADWYAVARENKTLEYIFKPATMVAVIAATLLIPGGAQSVWQARWFVIGFCLSLAGDVFLMLPNPRLFLFGLGAFLLAHVCFIVGLNPTFPPGPAPVLIVPTALVVGLVVRRVVGALRASNHSSMIPPVIGYGVAMTLMVFSAWATLFRADWNETRRALVIFGATSFLVSDALLAWNRFVKPFDAAKLAIIVTYHLGQVALALSVWG